MTEAPKLTDKQRRFVEEYLVDFNATQACIRAGYSKATAKQIGTENLSKPYIKTEIQSHMGKLSDGTGITVERWLREVGRIAFFDIRTLYDEDGNFKDPKDWDDDTAAAVAGLEISDYRNTTDGGAERLKKLKSLDKKGALDMLGKYFALYTETVKHDASDKFAEAVARAKEIAIKHGGASE